MKAQGKRRRWIVLHPRTRERLRRRMNRCGDAHLRCRLLIVLHADAGLPKTHIGRACGCARSTVDRVIDRYQAFGDAGLIDRREDNGQRKADTFYCSTLKWILEGTPQDFGHRRPRWTQQVLIDTAASMTGVRLSKRTLGRVLQTLKVRRGRPKPAAPCPWPSRRRKAAVSKVRALIETLPKNQVAVWEDEADIDLNPRLGPDYMLPGTQRVVMTPGKNVKRYLAGAMDARNDRLTWVKGQRKNSSLFLAMLKKLLSVYAAAKVIHVICDNYTIHHSKQTQAWLAEHGRRIKLHFLPPYCPDDNRIERSVWREMHANVTVNHRCSTIDELIHEVIAWLIRHNRRHPKQKAA